MTLKTLYSQLRGHRSRSVSAGETRSSGPLSLPALKMRGFSRRFLWNTRKPQPWCRCLGLG